MCALTPYSLLKKVNRPGRYIATEINAIKKNWTNLTVKGVLAFPDKYEIGMSSLGMQILYHVINQENNFCLERVFAPDDDMADQLKKNNMSLFSLETLHPLNAFDCIGFSLQTELSYTNVLYMLDLANIPYLASSRNNTHPLIFAGGVAAGNPVPMSRFIDFFVIGDGEEAMMDVFQALSHYANKTKAEKLRHLSTIQGIYVPILHKETTPIQKRTIVEFNSSWFPERPLIPSLKVIHDRAAVEIMRGCPRHCRFCHAGHTNRPVRIKEPNQVINEACTLMTRCGFENLTLLSLSSSDHPNIVDIAQKVDKEASVRKISVNLPSLRIDSYTTKLSFITHHIRKTGLTLAPEAGSQRLRNVINKDISEEQILAAIRAALEGNIHRIKLYMMIGLPTETQGDLEAIIILLRTILNLANDMRKKLELTLNISLFIPKPFTPFQWCSQISTEKAQERIYWLKDQVKRIKGIKIKYSDFFTANLEGLLSRGDTATGILIEHAFKNGARFDAWHEHLNHSAWEKAMNQALIKHEDYLGERSLNERLPWEFINMGVNRNYLISEYHLAQTEKQSSSCQANCTRCGAC